jgi:hypothetical protein
MRWLYPAVALGLGFHVLFAAVVCSSPLWLAVGFFAISCGAIDVTRLLGVTAADIGECLLMFAVWLVLSAADPFRPKQDD